MGDLDESSRVSIVDTWVCTSDSEGKRGARCTSEFKRGNLVKSVENKAAIPRLCSAWKPLLDPPHRPSRSSDVSVPSGPSPSGGAKGIRK